MGTILIIDDNSVNRFLLNVMLNGTYQLLEASSGEDGIRIAKTRKIDMILLDILMPNMDGYATASYLKADPKTHKIPIIFVTAMAGESIRAKAKLCGAADVITKPVSSSLLKARIQSYFTKGS